MNLYIIAVKFSMMIMDARQLEKFILNKAKKIWDQDFYTDQIYGKVLGIIGLGSIGQEIAKKASLMGLEVYGVRRIVEEFPYVKQVYSNEDMDVIFRKCDYIIKCISDVFAVEPLPQSSPLWDLDNITITPHIC